MTDLELFARLIQCEAGGEGDNGMKAVASVVMNRRPHQRRGIRALQYHPRRHLSGRSVQLRPHKAIRPDEPAKRLQYESDERSLRNCGMGDGGRTAGESLGSAVVLQPVFFHMSEQFPFERGVFPNPHWQSLLLQSSAVVCQYLMAKLPSPSAALQGAFPPGKIADAKPSNSATESAPPLTRWRHRAMLMMYTQGGTYFHDTRTRQGCRHDTGQYSAAIY